MINIYICLCCFLSPQAHSVQVEVGDRVKAGQFICLSGDAGYMLLFFKMVLLTPL